MGCILFFSGQTHFTHSICHFEAEFAVVDKKNHSAGAQARECGPPLGINLIGGLEHVLFSLIYEIILPID